MNWSLSEYNLIVYGHPELKIFNKQKQYCPVKS